MRKSQLANLILIWLLGKWLITVLRYLAESSGLLRQRIASLINRISGAADTAASARTVTTAQDQSPTRSTEAISSGDHAIQAGWPLGVNRGAVNGSPFTLIQDTPTSLSANSALTPGADADPVGINPRAAAQASQHAMRQGIDL